MNAALPRLSPQDCPFGPGSHLVRGAIEFVVLCVLQRGEMRADEIADAIGQFSRDELAVVEGQLHQALERLRLKGWVRARLALAPAGGHSLHRLTAVGARQWAREKAAWLRVSRAVTTVVESPVFPVRRAAFARLAERKVGRPEADRGIVAVARQRDDPVRRCA